MLYIDKFIGDYNKDKTYRENNVTEVISGYISKAFNAIDYDLAVLQDDINSGYYSNQDIFDYIQDIRDKL